MKAPRSSVLELKWWASSAVSLLAVLVVFSILDGLSRSLRESAGPDRLATAVGWALLLPLNYVLEMPGFFIGAALGVRLLVPTFAGVPPRVVAVICVVWPVGLGAFLQTLSPLFALEYVAAATLWALVMPMPRNDVLSYPPVIGGAIIGLALGSLAVQHDGLFLAIVWCAWRLYKNHPQEVIATAVFAAFLPGLLMINDIAHHTAGQYQFLEISLLFGIALAGLVTSQVRRPPLPETETETETE